ncbi:MAG: preprotein translocase subunit SecG [Candidatus Margulisbacteria bacterium GWF2_35_9]|nr:MAG: preprotein translocase subunit SecG [Candidatus Margulisbacteria bacterium GWF2_35_9]
MKIFLLAIQFVTGVGLILLVLLHSAKGEGFGSIGGQAKLFASQKGLEAGLNKITAVAAVLFVLASVLLSLIK